MVVGAEGASVHLEGALVHLEGGEELQNEDRMITVVQ